MNLLLDCLFRDSLYSSLLFFACSKKSNLKNKILSSNAEDGLQEGIVKFEVSETLQAVLFEAALTAELSVCSAANNKFRYRLVSLDLLFLLYQDKRKGIWIEVIDPS